jgi:hypothetical protein
MSDKLEHVCKAIERHDNQIARLFAKVDSTNEHLTDIQTSLLQIKYIGLGMVFYFVISEIGFIEGLKIVS